MIVSNEKILEVSYDVIICGSGPAGISLAIDLEKKGIKSLILEAGDEFYSEDSQKRYEGIVEGNFPKDLSLLRLSQFGGTSGHWGGTCRPLDSYDFSNWPFKKETLNEFVAPTSEFLNIKKKFLVIFRGINVDYFDPSTKLETDEKKLLEEWEINKEKKIILMPGRLTSWKGQEMFIESLNLVKIELGYEAFHVVILGNDQGRNLYKKKLLRLTEQYRLTNQIKFIDHCNDMALAYQVSDVVISASIEPEAFGRVAVEAQSMEKLMIASNIGGSNETIINEKTGFLFKSGDPNSLSQKIIQAITMDDTSTKLMGKEGRKNIIKKFNVEKMCFSTYSEYKRLLN